jgi:RNA polymerase sigma-70 factor (ECF subfamily)
MFWTAPARSEITGEIGWIYSKIVHQQHRGKIVTEANVNLEESSQATSLSLLERAKAQEPAAWERLMSLYAPLVDRWSVKAGLQDADAADVRQEVFLAVNRKIVDFHRDQAGDTFRGWLHRITQRKLSDHWRKTRGGPVTAGADPQEPLRQLPAQTDDAPEETQILYRRALELLRRDFEERTWQAFWRVVIDGQRPRDVALEMNMTANAVSLAKARVLARLREEFAGVIES